MTGNSDRYAAYARPDKIRFMFRDIDASKGERGYQMVFEAVQQMTGWSDTYTARHVKYQRIAPTKNGRTERAVIQLTYRAAEVVYQLPLSWMPLVTEVEMKTYVREAEEGAFDAFIDAIQATSGRVNATVFQNGAHAAAKKGARRRSVTMGSKKADQSVKAYKRQGELTGLEVAVRGKKVARLANEVAGYAVDSAGEIPAPALWGIFLKRCARLGYLHLAAELTRRGIDLAHYFDLFTEQETPNPDLAVTEGNMLEGSQFVGMSHP